MGTRKTARNATGCESLHFTSNWNTATDEICTELLRVGRAFWDDVRAERVFLTAEGDEVYRDDVIEIVEMLETEEREGDGQRLVVAEEEACM